MTTKKEPKTDFSDYVMLTNCEGDAIMMRRRNLAQI